MRRYQLIPSLAVQTLRITSAASLPTGEVSQPYSFNFNAIGGVQPYTWSSGTLPGGLSLSSSGTLSGTPTTAASSIFNVLVTDFVGSTFPLTCSLTIVAQLTITTTSPLPVASQSTAYSFTMVAANGQLPYSWSLLSQTGTNGWSLSSGGVITGTPANVETDILNIRVVDSLGVPSAANFNLQVTSSSLIFSPAPLPDAFDGTPYSQVVTFANGIAPWFLTAGPSWMTITSQNSTTATVGGTPTGSGVVTVTFQDSTP